MKDVIQSQIKVNFKKLKINVIFEILAFIVLSISIGYAANHNDPLLLNSKNFNYFYLVLIIFSLFYGLGAGVIALFTYTILGELFYKEFPLDFFLNGLLTTFISGEFHYYWTRKIENIQIKAYYLDEKVREIGTAALATKLSHDQIEKSYLSKPYTIRGAIIEILNKKDIDKFLDFISNQFFVQSFGLIFYDSKKNKITKIYTHNMENLDKNNILNNPIVEKMLDIKEIIYIKDIINESKDIKYIASIPILDLEDNVKAFLLIKEIPFIHYNHENLLSVQIITDYFLWQYEKLIQMEKSKVEILNYIPKEIQFEILKLYQLNKNIGVESVLIVFKINKSNSEIFDNFLNLGLRALDFHYKIGGTKFDIFLVVLPLVSKEGGFGFMNRVLNKFDFIDDSQKFNVFNIRNLKEVNSFIEEKLLEDKSE